MKRSFNKQLLINFIIFIGIFLRVFLIGHIPAGLTWDEAAITVDAWSISDDGTDQWGNKWPAVFKSLGDGKMPVTHYLLAAIYTVIPFQPIAIRWLSAVFGSLLIVGTYLLSKTISPNKTSVQLISVILISTLPWAIHFSRFGLEAGIATTFFVWGLLASMNSNTLTRILGIILMAVAAITYHSYLIISPAMFALLLIKRKPREIIASVVIFTFILAPVIITNQQQGWSRATQTIPSDVLVNLPKRILTHANPLFWVNAEQDNLRQYVPGFFIMPWYMIPLVVFGSIQLWRSQSPYRFLIISWFIVSLIPSLIGNLYPHTIRLFGIAPILCLIAGLGYERITNRYLQAGVISAIVLTTAVFWQQYTTAYSSRSEVDFQYGYQQLFAAIKQNDRNVTQFVISDIYGHPYLYSLIYQHISPKEFRSGGLANFRFRPLNWSEEELDGKHLYAGTPAEIPITNEHVIEVITDHKEQPIWIIAR